MKYFRYSFMIMVVCLALTIFNSYAAELGVASIINVKIDFLGFYHSSLHLKQTSKPQYAKKSSCNGAALGLDTNVSARVDRFDVAEGVWTPLSNNGTDTKLKGDLQVVGSQYELNLKSTGTVESCYFVGTWTYN